MTYPLGFIKDVMVLPMAVSFVMVFIATPAVISLAKYLGLVDNPKTRPHPAHTDTRVIPRAGGLGIFLGVVIAITAFVPITPQILGMMVGGAVLVVVGLFDDKKDVNPYIRLFGANLFAALAAVFAGAGINYITNPFGGVIVLPAIVGLGATILWIMWVVNMVGWSGGVDGQLPGFVAVASFFIGLLALRQVGENNFPYWTVATLSFITSGAYLGFLPWNFYPQKIMPGYSGKSLAGFLIATIAVMSVAKVGTAILVLGIPMIDAIIVMALRILRRGSPVYASRDHLHHRLLDLGWSKRAIALFYWVVSAILGIVALGLSGGQKYFVFVVLFILVGLGVLWLNYYISWRNPRG